jgi:hypothetical protein
MKTLMATTALAATMGFATVSLAQDATMPATGGFVEGVDTGVRASDFIGKRVYLTEADTSGLSATAVAAANADWEDAGEISDIIISMAGDTEVVLVDFGGFLGIGEKTVAVSMNELVMVPDSSSADDYFIVFNGSRAELETAPVFNPDMVFEADPAVAPVDDSAMAPADGTTEMAPADGTAEMAPADGTTEMAPADTATADPAAAPMEEAVDLATWAEADLIGKRVYGPNDEDVGEISAVSMTADGKVQSAVVDVGGFLGMGEKPVALSSEMLMLVREADGDLWFRVNATQDQLETMEIYTN